ncbi:MAG: hypothetical protein ACR2IP_06945 [Solirubrobacteraceae bacterium]
MTIARSPPAAGAGDELVALVLEDPDATDELDELEEPPHAAINAPNPVAAAAPPIDLPAIRKNRFRATSSRAKTSTAPR